MPLIVAVSVDDRVGVNEGVRDPVMVAVIEALVLPLSDDVDVAPVGVAERL